MKTLLTWLKDSAIADRDQLMLFVPVLFGLGIAIYFSLLTEPSFWLAPILAIMSGALYYLLRHRRIRYALAALLLAALGFANAQMTTHRLHSPVLAEPIFFKTVEGQVESILLSEKSHKVVISNPKIETLAPDKTPHQVRISFRKWDNAIQIGDTVNVKATLFPLPKPIAPGAFDFGRYLYFKGLGGVGFSPRLPDVVHKASEQSSIDAFRYRFATNIIEQMEPPYGAIGAALTVGEQQAIPEEVNEALRDSGLYHILSISGLHLAIAAGIVFFTLRLLLALLPGVAVRWPIKKMAAVGALIASILYLLAAGAPVPAQRSCIMVSVVFLAILIDRKGLSMVSLAWAAMLVLIFQPDSITSASFHLSFAATAAIVALYEKGGSWLHPARSGWIRKAIYAVLATVMVSLVATLATGPFVMTHFNRLQLWGIVANAAVSPITTFMIMPGVVLSFLLTPFGLEGLGFQWLEWGVAAMMKIAAQVAGMPYASVYTPSPTTIGFCLAAFGMVWFLLLKARWRLVGIAIILIGLATAILYQPPDILINDDGKQMAMRGKDGQYVMIKGRGDSFVAGAWAKMLGMDEMQVNKTEGHAASDWLNCEKKHCILTRDDGFKAVFIFDWKLIKDLCKTEQPDLLVMRYRLRKGECASATNVIDRNTLERDGSHSIHFVDGKAVLDSAKHYQGHRPWVAGW